MNEDIKKSSSQTRLISSIHHFISRQDFQDRISSLNYTVNEDKKFFETYFERLVNFFVVPDISERLGEMENYLMIGCCKLDLEDIYYMPMSHPIIRLINEEIIGLQRYWECCSNTQFLHEDNPRYMEWQIRHTLLKQYIQQREQLYVYGTGQVYFANVQEKLETDTIHKYVEVKAWQNVGALTKLDALRLVQKINSRYSRKEKTPLIYGENVIYIAYIGTIENIDCLIEYYRNIVTDQNNKSLEVYFVQLLRQPEYGEYIFRLKDDDSLVLKHDKQIYNLSSLLDMQILFQSFDIVLFLDESYFYKQRQTLKKLQEREIRSYIQWCLKELERKKELLDEVSDSNQKEDFVREQGYYYREIYNKAGLWMNGYGKAESSKLGFDCELFRIMQQAVSEQSDVYVYISRGEKVGDVDLVKNSVCNDERYDGKRIFVYRLLPPKSNEDDAASNAVVTLISNGVVPQDNNKAYIASIDMWKLIKSVGSAFYKEKVNQNEYSSIDVWMNTFLDIYVKKDQVVRLECYIRFPQNIEETEREFLNKFMETYLQICKEEKCEEHSPYSRNYLRDLFTRAMIARSNSALGIFCAYLLCIERISFTNIDLLSERKSELVPLRDNGKLFRGRRLIYSAVRELDRAIVRDMEKLDSILRYDFRMLYCPEIMEDDFFDLLSVLHEYCIYTGYVDSRIYLLTK